MSCTRPILRHLVPALGLAALTAAAQAQTAAPAAPASPHSFTGNFGLYSQYVFRGLTQTNEKPALQGGFDYAHSSGFYAGVWGSNISWISDAVPDASVSLELDTYLGFKKALSDDLTLDVGFLRYNYPGSYPSGMTKADTNELYAAITWKWITAKYSYSLGDTFGVSDARGTDYIDLAASYEVAPKLTLSAHWGRQKYRGAGHSDFTYDDWKAGIAYELSGFNLGLYGTGTNAKDSAYTIRGKNIGNSQVVVYVSKTF